MDGGIDILAGGIGLFIVWVLVVVATIALVVWAIIDAIKNPGLSDTARIIWILVILFFPCIGSILYLAIGRNTTPPGSRMGV